MTEPLHPLPRRLSKLVGLDGHASRSLVFDRGFDGFARRQDGRWQLLKADPKRDQPDGKTSFLTRFAAPGAYTEPADFAPFLERRKKALQSAGALPVPLRAQSRLAIGLGLPHPTQTALLLDRLTGCPYVPGSSVKGALRAAAGRVADGVLDTGEPSDREFWRQYLDRLFGPSADSDLRARGEIIAYDAFPAAWPRLEVDVLTPHYQDYYGDDAERPRVSPGDWQDPTPVAFPSVAPGTELVFWLGPSKGALHRDDLGQDENLDRLKRLLRTTLRRIGIGAKTSTGYGLFDDTAPAAPRAVEPPERRRGEAVVLAPQVSAPRLGRGEVRWEGAVLLLLRGRPTAKTAGGETAGGLADVVEPDVLGRLRQSQVLRADVVVRQLGSRWSLLRVERVHD